MPERGRTTRDQDGPEGHIPSAAVTDAVTEPTATAAAAAPVPPPDARRSVGLLVTLVLGGLTAVPPLSMDMYLPALPGGHRAPCTRPPPPSSSPSPPASPAWRSASSSSAR